MPKIRVRTLVVAALLATSVIGVRGQAHRAHLSDDLLSHVGKHTKARARVIVRGTTADLDALAARHRVQIVRRLPDAVVVLANSAELNELASDAGVDKLSGDVRVRTWMSVSNKSTAADQTRAGKPGLLLGIGAIAPVTGKDIGVAVIDSGISAHPALTGKIAANVSFIDGDPSYTDAYGHGTHVAGIIAGSPTSVTSLYTGGIAPGVKLVNLRVLGADGSGYVSDVIDAIEWAIAHRVEHNIRVINLSLGHPVMEKCADDLLCQEVGKAVQQYGIVVVAAAGNYGRSADGQHMILGGIASPGNSPYAITVGALNTWNTVKRTDDTVATFSSRGPTAQDYAVKPDLAAPGVKIVSLQANNSLLPTLYPSIHVAGSATNGYMYLSGTSMAAPMVSGGVALLLHGQPGLSPSQVKLALQTGASYMSDGGLMGAGAGSVNFWAARQNANSGLVGALVNTLVGGLLTAPSGAAYWDAGTMSNRLYNRTGIRLLTLLEQPLVWLNTSLLRFGDLNLLGLTNPLASVHPKWLQYGTVGGYTSDETIMWGTSLQDENGETIMWGTSGDEETIMWGTSATSPDAR